MEAVWSTPGAGNEKVDYFSGFVLRHEEHPRHVGDEDAPHTIEAESFAGLIAYDVFTLCRQGHGVSYVLCFTGC